MDCLTHKRGTDFSYAGPGTLPTGSWTARSQIRARVGGRLLADLVAIVTTDDTLPDPFTHTLSLESNDDTSAWHAGKYLIDVKFYSSDAKIATQTIEVNVVDRNTEDD